MTREAICFFTGPMLKPVLMIENKNFHFSNVTWAPMGAGHVKSLCFESGAKNNVSRLGNFAVKEKFYASTIVSL